MASVFQPPPKRGALADPSGNCTPLWLKWFVELTQFINASGVAGAVPTSRVINATFPVRIDGAASADLSAARTLSDGRLLSFRDSDASSTSATLANDSALSVTVEIGTYIIRGFLAFYEVTLGTGGFKFDLAGGSATISSIVWSAEGYDVAAIANPAATASNTAQAYGTVVTSSTAPSWVAVHGNVKFSAAGTFILRWAQNAASANATTLKARSYLALEKAG